MSFLAGPECSTAGNPLTSLTKHVQDDKSLQRDRLVSGHGAGRVESMRTQRPIGQHDHMMHEFLQQQPKFLHQQSQSPGPFATDQLRRELDNISPAQSARPQPWKLEGDFRSSGPRQHGAPSAFSAAEFHAFQGQGTSVDGGRMHSPLEGSYQESSTPTSAGWRPTLSPVEAHDQYYSKFQGLMTNRNLRMGVGMAMPMHSSLGTAQSPATMATTTTTATTTADVKGKSRVVELVDDETLEAQFAEIEAAGRTKLDEGEANATIEEQLNAWDKMHTTSETMGGDFENIWKGIESELSDGMRPGEGIRDWPKADLWSEFDSFNTGSFRDPQLGDYMFEEENAFRTIAADPFDEGMKIMREGGNLSLAALAFEASVQRDPQHVEAWTMLGTAQAQNEKETPAIRALEQAHRLDPANLDALMGLAVSYTNEGYELTAYRTLERWLSAKYPSVVPPPAADSRPKDDPTTEMGFTDRAAVHERVTERFLAAAQLCPSGERMDPDVQVGLGVLFYGADEFDKAVDCFSAALASTEPGSSNRPERRHLLWNRLGATLANGGRSEEAVAAYERALELAPNFVRARYNLGVSCINMGCPAEAAQHLLGALAMHEVVEREGKERLREVLSGGNSGGASGVGSGGSSSSSGSNLDEAKMRRMTVNMNQSTNLLETLRRVFVQMGRRDLSDRIGPDMNVDSFRDEFEF